MRMAYFDVAPGIESGDKACSSTHGSPPLGWVSLVPIVCAVGRDAVSWFRSRLKVLKEIEVQKIPHVPSCESVSDFDGIFKPFFTGAEK
jgi:hypothetical protein